MLLHPQEKINKSFENPDQTMCSTNAVFHDNPLIDAFIFFFAYFPLLLKPFTPFLIALLALLPPAPTSSLSSVLASLIFFEAKSFAFLIFLCTSSLSTNSFTCLAICLPSLCKCLPRSLAADSASFALLSSPRSFLLLSKYPAMAPPRVPTRRESFFIYRWVIRALIINDFWLFASI